MIKGAEKQRENICGLIIGKRRNGKSTFIVDELIPAYLRMGIDVIVIQGKRNTVYDKYINHKNVKVHLVKSISDCKKIMARAFNTVFIYDDSQLLIGTRLDEDIRKLIINLGQTNCDCFFVFHSFTAATRELWTLCDVLEIFFVKESAAARSEFLSREQIQEIDKQVSELQPYKHFTFER